MVAKDLNRDPRRPDRLDNLRHSGLDFTVASQVEEVVEAWQLVHTEYLRAGLIEPSPHRVHTHQEAIDPGTAVIVGKIRSLVVSTMSVYLDRQEGLPLDASCHEAMQALRRDGHRLVEMGLFADRREKISRSFAALLNLMRYAFFYAMHSGASDIVIGVHPHHADFYQRLLGFVPFAKPTSCPRVNDHPMVPLRLDIHGGLVREPLPKGLAFFKANPLGPDAYADRLAITRAAFEGTAVGRYLWAEREAGSPPRPHAELF